MTAAVVLAHQGGWDEMLMVLGPIVLMAGLLRLAKKRVEARESVQSESVPARAVTSTGSGEPTVRGEPTGPTSTGPTRPDAAATRPATRQPDTTER